MISRYILPALAAASGAYAQCSTSATVTLSAITDATAIAGCATYTGSIALATSLSGDLSLNGIQKITGSLQGTNLPNVTSISATTLTSIGSNFTLEIANSLNAINMNSLQSVGALTFITLGPQYQTAGFNNLSNVPSLTIQNTYLQSLEGISIANTANDVAIAQNSYLTSITLNTYSVKGALSITDNAADANVSLPQLVSVGSLEVTSAGTIDMPALQNATQSITIRNNYFTTLSLPNVTQSNGLTINNNTQMTNFTTPSYTTTLGSLDVHDNSALTGTISMPALTTVDGTANFTGAFSGLYLPKLNTIQGSLYINSTNTLSATCSTYTPLANNKVHGMVTCNGGSSKSSSGTSSGSASGTAASSTATKTSAATTVAVSAASPYTVFGVLAAFFGLLM